MRCVRCAWLAGSMSFTVEELSIPASVGDDSWADFVAAVEARNASEAHGYGSAELRFPAEEVYPNWLDPNEPKRLFAARVDGRIVARAVHETQLGEGADTAWLDVHVHPEFRGRGIGTALAERVEGIARELGQVRAIVYTVSPEGPGERLPSPTGFGSVPRDNPEVRFLLAHGYALEQVERASRFAIPGDPAAVESQLADAARASGADYALHTWIGRTPPEWLDGVALAYTRMSTDAPSAGLDEPIDVWDAARVVAREENESGGARRALFAGIEHLPSGTLAGFTELYVPHDVTRPVAQGDTIVLREHRGHRLGMLLKVGNLAHLSREAPGHPSVLTWNAEENRHMLSVNEAVGFVPIGAEGAWKKVL